MLRITIFKIMADLENEIMQYQKRGTLKYCQKIHVTPLCYYKSPIFRSMKFTLWLFSLLLCLITYSQENDIKQGVSLIVLGTVQDGGSPHIGCQKTCCKELFERADPSRKVVALGLVDHQEQKTYLFEATPDFSSQIKELKRFAGSASDLPHGIFLTHAHIGHYTGLMYLGKEAMGSKKTPVYAMPRMKSFLESNGPWSQLVSEQNIIIQAIFNADTVHLSERLKVLPFQVPHRDEYSETVGYQIIGPNKSALFIPDIDKWIRWRTSIVQFIKKVDYAFVDATFYDNKEINNRDIAEIPHPFVIESLLMFEELPVEEKNKIQFIHFNHTNPLLNDQSEEAEIVRKKGLNLAKYQSTFKL